jgi:SNF2 family DNA or RNA helicase
MVGEHKSDAVCDYVAQRCRAGIKLIVFAHHRQVMDKLCGMLTRDRVEHVRIDGQVEAAERTVQEARFQQQTQVSHRQ